MTDATTIHIANGDLDVRRLQAMGLPNVHPWREALADGPTMPRRADLVPLRKEFVTKSYSSSAEEYENRVVPTLTQLTTGLWQQAILHFHADLFCVVNAIFLVAQSTSIPTIRWYLKGTILELTTMERTFLSSCWRAYAGTDPQALVDLIKQTPPRCSFVAQALRSHLLRFPNPTTHLGKPQEILKEILDRGLTDNEDIVQAFIAIDANEYGWGDVQILRELRTLRQLQSGGTTIQHLGGTRVVVPGPHWQWSPVSNQLRWSED